MDEELKLEFESYLEKGLHSIKFAAFKLKMEDSSVLKEGLNEEKTFFI